MKTLCLVLCGLVATALNASRPEIPLNIEEPSGVAREGWPVTSGVPFSRGALRTPEAVTLAGEGGVAVPVQTEVLARWPDGSVRWLLVDCQVNLAAREKKTLYLRPNPDPEGKAAENTVRVKVSKMATLTTIDTGALKVELDENHFDPFGAVWLDRNRDGVYAQEERVLRGNEMRGGFFVCDKGGQRYGTTQAPAEIVVEESGPLRACVRITGRHASERGAFFRYEVRMHFYAGQSFVRCLHTFVNDQPGSGMTSYKEAGLELALAREAGAPAEAFLGGQGRGGRRLFQAEDNRYEIDGKAAGARAPGWVMQAGARAGYAIGLREFWQQWPKAIAAKDGAVTMEFCPGFREGLYDGKPLAIEHKLYCALRGGVYTIKTGVAKTHEFWVRVFAEPATAEATEGFFAAAEAPLLAVAAPEYVSATKAAGEFPPADAKCFFGYDACVERALASHLARREKEREYGVFNFGDWYGERKVNWGNLEYDLQHGLFQQYLRTGERRYFDRAAQAARHHIDVDTIHAVNKEVKNPFGGPPKEGEQWLHCVGHTGGYYENAPLPVERAYQMGHSANYGHIWISGDLDYYYLTGERRAREVALKSADMMAEAMTAKVGTHIRTLGWPMVLVMAAHEATGDAKYLEVAKRNWQALQKSLDPKRGWVVKLASDHCLHPEGSTREQRDKQYRDQRCEGNVPFMEGLTLCALARYHRVTNDPEVLRAITVGVDQMIRECWQEDLKTLRYTACPLSNKTPYGLFMLCAEAIAYEARLTGNAEHARILRAGFKSAVEKSGGDGFGKGLGQMTFFAPMALEGVK